MNDAHEANIAVYTPDEQMRRADLLSEIAGLKRVSKERTPDWPERLSQWEAACADDQPDWVVLRPDVDTSGGENICRRKTVRSWPPATLRPSTPCR